MTAGMHLAGHLRFIVNVIRFWDGQGVHIAPDHHQGSGAVLHQPHHAVAADVLKDTALPIPEDRFVKPAKTASAEPSEGEGAGDG